MAARPDSGDVLEERTSYGGSVSVREIFESGLEAHDNRLVSIMVVIEGSSTPGPQGFMLNLAEASKLADDIMQALARTPDSG